MQIALISDSHGGRDRLASALAKIRDGRVRDVFHAGDFLVDGVAEILAQFPELQIRIARGNCDIDEAELTAVRKLSHVELAETIEVVVDNKKILMTHAPVVPPADVDFYFHGHTHRPRHERKNGVAIVNPGSLFDSGFYFLVELESGEVEVERFDREI